jgi:hypothetical protein
MKSRNNTNSNISVYFAVAKPTMWKNIEPPASVKSLNHEVHKEHEEKKNLCALRVLRG